VMVAEIGDITRFPNARKPASWAGLTPTVRGPDLKVRHGHISKQGPVWLRWAMNQATQTAKRSPDFAASYTALAQKRGKKIATIAIARKLVTCAWHRPQPGSARSRRARSVRPLDSGGPYGCRIAGGLEPPESTAGKPHSPRQLPVSLKFSR
jgi:transposase